MTAFPNRDTTRAIARKIGEAAGGQVAEDAVAALIMGLAWFAIYLAESPADAHELAAGWAEVLAELIDENWRRQKAG